MELRRNTRSNGQSCTTGGVLPVQFAQEDSTTIVNGSLYKTFADQAVYNASGEWVSGKWGPTAPANGTEPDDLDGLAQPAKPDISALTNAMTDACIVVKEIAQTQENTAWRLRLTICYRL